MAKRKAQPRARPAPKRAKRGPSGGKGNRRPSLPRFPANPAFFLDVDGTLLEIADRPHEVRVEAELITLLLALRKKTGGALALISGRSLSDVDGLIGRSDFCVAGQHGAERRDARGRLHRHRVPLGGLRDAGKRLRLIARTDSRLDLEDKGVNFALHYRLAPERGPMLRKTLESLVRALGKGFELQTGKRVLEIKPKGFDKGQAVAEFMSESPFLGRVPVFIGDDRTDEHGFKAVNRMRGCSVKVGNGPSEARWRVRDVAAVRARLARFLRSRC